MGTSVNSTCCLETRQVKCLYFGIGAVPRLVVFDHHDGDDFIPAIRAVPSAGSTRSTVTDHGQRRDAIPSLLSCCPYWRLCCCACCSGKYLTATTLIHSCDICKAPQPDTPSRPRLANRRLPVAADPGSQDTCHQIFQGRDRDESRGTRRGRASDEGAAVRRASCL